MEEKRKITSGNKIPGCERLTRPEEIQGLSKYLGAIRDTQEQWISENMPDSPLSGPEDARIKTIKLPDKRIRLDGNKDVVLPNHKEGLDIEHEINLPRGKEKLDVEDPKLKKDKIRLKVEDPELKTDRIDIHVRDPKELPDDKVNIHPKDPNSLPSDKEPLNVEDPKLKTGKERLVIEEPIELPDSLVKISVNELPGLPKDKEKIYPQEVNVSLPNSKSTLNNIEDPSLPEGLVELQDLRNIKLPEGKEGISVEFPKELPDTTVNIYPEEPDDLRQHIEGLFAEEPDSLRQQRLGLEITEPEKLPWEVLEISPDFPDKLPDDRLRISPEGPGELPKDRLEIHPEDPELPNFRIDINPGEVELPNSRLDIKPDEIKELPGDKLYIDVPDIKRIEEVLDSMSADELYEELMSLLVPGQTGAELTGQGNIELAGIISAYLGDTQLSDRRAHEVAQKIADTLQKQKKLLDYAGYIGKEGLNREETLSEKATRSQSLDIPEKDTILSKYTDQQYRQEYGEENRVQRARYQVSENEDPTRNPTSFLNPALYDQDRYIRRLAELAADAASNTNLGKLSSTTREYILKNTLMALVVARNKLEKLTGVDRSRLPGGSAVLEGIQSLVQGGATGLVGGGIGSFIRRGFNSIAPFIDGITGGIDTSKPQNRPKGKVDIATGRLEEIRTEKLRRLNKESISTDVVDAHKEIVDGLTGELGKVVNNISTTAQLSLNGVYDSLGLDDGIAATLMAPLIKKKDSLVEKIKGATDNWKSALRGEVVFNTSDYFAGEGIELTLMDLCPNSDSINTLEDFKQALINSPYITNPWKLMKRKDGNLTLDTNAYWEVVIEPYISNSQNGGWSYLPSIAEINRENTIEHNHHTKYSKWIPINGFELQKSKLVSKSLGLFDGEINYPVSVEYTNELRISVVDDQYKSWRRYFQRCADVSTYFSEAHDRYFYMKEFETIPTAIDKSMICIAYYKNVTFRIRVYCMTPQYSTIKKFDLLCVMKDFNEEYSGEIEGGGQDLSISFSIVGENPPDDTINGNEVPRSPLESDSVKPALEQAVKNSTTNPKVLSGYAKAGTDRQDLNNALLQNSQLTTPSILDSNLNALETRYTRINSAIEELLEERDIYL